jgi:hypothetical protein
VSFVGSEGKIHETPIAPGKRRSDHSPSTNPGCAQPRLATGARFARCRIAA